MRKNTNWLALLLVFAAASGFAKGTPETWDGLVEVKAKRMDAVFLMPGADFRPYTKVMIDKTQAAFQKDWLKNMNRMPIDLSRQVTDEQAAKILEAARTNFDDIIAEALKDAGYEVVSAPGPDVMRISAAVVNLYVNAPDVQAPGVRRTYTMEAGEATLILEVRDSTTGALMGRAVDRRDTRTASGFQVTNSVTNMADFRALFKQWGRTVAKGLQELKELSPVPQDLKPKQKL